MEPHEILKIWEHKIRPFQKQVNKVIMQQKDPIVEYELYKLHVLSSIATLYLFYWDAVTDRKSRYEFLSDFTTRLLEEEQRFERNRQTIDNLKGG